MTESGPRQALGYATLLVCLFWIYRDGIADIPRGDELGYLREKNVVAPGAPWFWHVVSFTRARLCRVPDAGHLVIRQAWPMVLAAATG